MNELASLLKTASAAMRTVRIIEIVKKATVIVATVMCCIFAWRFFSK